MPDASGTPTSPDNIPTFNTATDPPSGKGFNTAMAQIQSIITNLKAGTLASGKILASALSGLVPTANLGTGTANSGTFLRGDQTWASPSGAMVQLYDSTLGTSAASFDISGISQSYNHLRIVWQLRSDEATTRNWLHVKFNNDSGANYFYDDIIVINSAVSGAPGLADTLGLLAGMYAGASSTAGIAGGGVIDIQNYTGTTWNKTSVGTWTVSSDGTAANQAMGTNAGRWGSSAAINRITLLPTAGNFVAGSRVTIYGLS